MKDCKLNPNGDCEGCKQMYYEGCAILEFRRKLSNGSPYSYFGYASKDLRGIPEAKDYTHCPNCGWEVPEDLETYSCEGEEYPQCYNEYLSSTPDGTIHDWDELYCCPKCKTKFIISDGCF